MKVLITDLSSCGVNYEKEYILQKLSPTLEYTDSLEDADILLMLGGCCCTEPQLQVTLDSIELLLNNKNANTPTYLIGCITKEFIPHPFFKDVYNNLITKIDHVYSQYNPDKVIEDINGTIKHKESYGACFLDPLQGDIFIQNGCIHHCSFCKTNYTKCNLIDSPFEKIQTYIDAINEHNIKTIQLRGLNIAQYGLHLYGKHMLMDICEYIEKNTDIEEIILSNMAFSDAIKNNFDERLKHFKKNYIINSSLESGSNRLLALMNKGFTKEEFLEFYYNINSLYQKYMALNIISGFPTETVTDCLETLEVLKTIDPIRVNINTYLDSQFVPAHNLEQLPYSEIRNHTRIYSRILKNNNIRYDINGFN